MNGLLTITLHASFLIIFKQLLDFTTVELLCLKMQLAVMC